MKMKQCQHNYNFWYLNIASGFVPSSLTCTVAEEILLRYNKKGVWVFMKMHLKNISFWMVSMLEDIAGTQLNIKN